MIAPVWHGPPALVPLLRPVGELREDPANARSHPEPNLAAIKASYSQHGQQKPLVVEADGTVLAGNGQLRAAVALGWTHLAAVTTDQQGPQARAYAIRDNQTALSAEWDDEQLRLTLDELKVELPDLEAVDLGFDEADLAGLDARLREDVEEDEAPEPLPDALAQRGDIITLGRHSLYCGDAREVLAAIPDASIDLVLTDPPYGHNNNDGDLAHNREAALGVGKAGVARPIANDGPEANDLARWLFALAARVLKPGCCCCCCCCGGGPDPQFARWSLWLDEAIPFKQMVVWDKGGLGMGWHWRRNYEVVLVAEKPGAACNWHGGHDQPNVLAIPGIKPREDEHPTAKPVALMAVFVRVHSAAGEVVLDPCAGHGTTLIAADQLGRRAILCEIDGGFCDVIVRRWLAYCAKAGRAPDVTGWRGLAPGHSAP